MREVEPQTGVKEREQAASSYYPKEWPEEFIFHGARGDMRCRSSDEVGQLTFIRIDRGFEELVLRRLLPRQEDGFVSGPEVKTTLAIEALGPLIRFIYQQAD